MNPRKCEPCRRLPAIVGERHLPRGIGRGRLFARSFAASRFTADELVTTAVACNSQLEGLETFFDAESRG